MAEDEERQWTRELAHVVGQRVKEYREGKTPRLSARKLADRTEELGHRVEYQIIANVESGRRSYVTLAELVVLAAALEVPLMFLIAPVGSDTDVEVLPGHQVDAWTAYRLFTGQQTAGASLDEGGPAGEVDAVLNTYRRHDHQLAIYAALPKDDEESAPEREARLDALVAVRNEMRRAEWRPPDLAPDLAAAVQAAETEASQR